MSDEGCWCSVQGPAQLVEGVLVRVARRGVGRVAWVGTLPEKDGVWVGVALQERSGKHDGEIRVVPRGGGPRTTRRLFRCEPGHGVVVQFEHVHDVLPGSEPKAPSPPPPSLPPVTFSRGDGSWQPPKLVPQPQQPRAAAAHGRGSEDGGDNSAEDDAYR